MTHDPYSWYVILAEHQTYSHHLQHELSSVPSLQSIKLPNQLGGGQRGNCNIICRHLHINICYVPFSASPFQSNLTAPKHLLPVASSTSNSRSPGDHLNIPLCHLTRPCPSPEEHHMPRQPYSKAFRSQRPSPAHCTFHPRISIFPLTKTPPSDPPCTSPSQASQSTICVAYRSGSSRLGEKSLLHPSACSSISCPTLQNPTGYCSTLIQTPTAPSHLNIPLCNLTRNPAIRLSSDRPPPAHRPKPITGQPVYHPHHPLISNLPHLQPHETLPIPSKHPHTPDHCNHPQPRILASNHHLTRHFHPYSHPPVPSPPAPAHHTKYSPLENFTNAGSEK